MSKSLSLNDSGKDLIVDQCTKTDINDVVSEVKKQLKTLMIENAVEMNGLNIDLTTSKTAFDGTRYWFKCPICDGRVGVIYQHPLSKIVGCRKCLGLQYKSQRYKGMLENNY